MLNIIENVFFKLQTIKKVLVNNNVLSYCLHCVHFLCFPVLYQENFAESSPAKHFLDLEILKSCTLFSNISLPSEYEGATLSHSGPRGSRVFIDEFSVLLSVIVLCNIVIAVRDVIFAILFSVALGIIILIFSVSVFSRSAHRSVRL